MPRITFQLVGRSLAAPLRHPGWRRIFVAQLVSELGDWAARLAVMILVYDRTRSPTLTAFVVTASMLPWVGLGQLVTAATERLPRRAVMITVLVLLALVYGVMALPVPTPVLFVGVFVAGCAVPAFDSARFSIKSELSEDEGLYGAAQALTRTIAQVATILGFTIGGSLVALTGARGALLLNAVSFLGAAVVLRGLKLSRLPRVATRERDSTFQRFRTGARLMLRDPVLRWLLAGAPLTAATGMMVEGIVTVYGKGRPFQVTLLEVSLAVGCVSVALLAPHAGEPGRLLRFTGLLPVVGGALGVLAFLSLPAVPEAGVGFALIGAASSVQTSAGPVLGRRLPSSSRASGFSLISGFACGGLAGGALIGGVLASHLGVVTTCVIACATLTLGGLLLLLRLPDPSVALDEQLLSSPPSRREQRAELPERGAGVVPHEAPVR